MAWFKKTRKPIATAAKEKPSRVPEGLWVKCPGCAQVIYNKDLAANLNVCPKCAHHFRINATERLRMLFDGEWIEYDKDLVSTDPLEFTDTKPYKTRLKASIDATGLNDAVIVASGTIDGIPAIVAAMEYGFIGGSMGVVVGEKITRAIERAIDQRLPVVIVCCSGGARMMEGALSLMQMAKICGALARLDRARLPYIAVLTDPTTGGVTASFAMLGDLNIAEPKAQIGFAGPRVIEQTIRQKLPGGIPAQRVPARKGHARPGRRSPRDEDDDRQRAALHGRRAVAGSQWTVFNRGCRAGHRAGAASVAAAPSRVKPKRRPSRNPEPKPLSLIPQPLTAPLAWLFALEQFGIKFGLENISRHRRASRPPGARVPFDPHRGHERQRLGNGDGRRRTARRRSSLGALHVAAPGRSLRALRHRRTAGRGRRADGRGRGRPRRRRGAARGRQP